MMPTGVLKPPDADMDRVVAAASLLIDTTPEWLTRRVEHVVFLEEGVRRRITADVTPPEATPNVPLALAFVGKSSGLTHIEVTTGSGRALPLLTRRETGEVSFMALILAAIQAGVTPTPAEEELILTVALGPSDEAESALQLLVAEQRAWTQQEQLAQLARRAATEIPILVALDPAEGRQVVRIDLGVLPLRAQHEPFLRSLLRVRSSVMLDIVGAPTVGSYHLNMEAPPGMEITKLEFLDGTSHRTEIRPGGQRSVHLYLPGPRPADRAGIVRLELAAPRIHSRLLLLLSVVVVALLVSVSAVGDNSGFSTTGATLLLLAPGLAASQLTRETNGTIAYVRGLRAAATTLSIAALLGASAVALVGPSSGGSILAVAIVLALLAGGRLAFAVLGEGR
jgi:hypothetical protein